MSDKDNLVEVNSAELVHGSIETSRMGAYSVLGALTAAVPLPWVPDQMLKRVRSTLLHDVAARHGLSMSEEARTILSEPWSSDLQRSLLAQAARFALRRVTTRLGPLGWLAPVRSAASTFIVGHLFERYLETARTSRAIRIDENEARTLRAAMDRTLKLFITLDVTSPLAGMAAAPEDLRNGTTQMIDGVILSLASLPAWAVKRLEAAFDDALAQSSG
jgi:plasmid stability protein